MLILSYLINVVITFAVSRGLLRGTEQMDAAFGPPTPARAILTSVYLAIGLISLLALVQIATGRRDAAVLIAWGLFPMQITYKLLTVWLLGPSHPVVITNLGVVALHCATLWLLWSQT